jgi:heavy metal sensor kinase
MTIRRKLLFWYTGVLAVSGLIMMLATYLLVEHQMRREVDKFLQDDANDWIRLCHEGAGSAALEQRLRSEVARERYFPLVCRLYNPAARRNEFLIAPEKWARRLDFEINPSGLDPRGDFSTVSVGNAGEEVRLFTIALKEGEHVGLVLQAGLYNQRLQERLRLLRLYFGGAFAATVLLGLAGGWMLAGHSLQTVDEVARQLERIESENLSYRLEVAPTRDEAERLRLAINRMLGRLQESFEKIGGFTADAAHELRTPLASLQCRLEVALSKARTPDEYRQVLADALTETAHLVRMVNNLLFLARMDARALTPQFEPVSLRDLLADVQELFAEAATAHGLRLTMNCDERCVVRGDAALLRRLFGNLADNAIRYTPAGGSVALTGRVDAGYCLVSVEDTGIGIAPEAQQRIFDRFFRTDESRSREAGGAGLGLNICRSIVEAHRGAISVRSETGKGSTFEVRLPVAASS